MVNYSAHMVERLGYFLSSHLDCPLAIAGSGSFLVQALKIGAGFLGGVSERDPLRPPADSLAVDGRESPDLAEVRWRGLPTSRKVESRRWRHCGCEISSFDLMFFNEEVP